MFWYFAGFATDIPLDCRKGSLRRRPGLHCQGSYVGTVTSAQERGKLAQNAGVSAEEAAKEWAANIIPGITVIPSGTWGVNRAQEHGCTYCAGG